MGVSSPRVSLQRVSRQIPPRSNSSGASDWRLARNNNLELETYRYGAVPGKSDFHVDISKSPRGKEKILRRNEMKLRKNQMKLRKK